MKLNRLGVVLALGWALVGIVIAVPVRAADESGASGARRAASMRLGPPSRT
jgi:hypothetical protein